MKEWGKSAWMKQRKAVLLLIRSATKLPENKLSFKVTQQLENASETLWMTAASFHWCTWRVLLLPSATGDTQRLTHPTSDSFQPLANPTYPTPTSEVSTSPELIPSSSRSHPSNQNPSVRPQTIYLMLPSSWLSRATPWFVWSSCSWFCESRNYILSDYKFNPNVFWQLN